MTAPSRWALLVSGLVSLTLHASTATPVMVHGEWADAIEACGGLEDQTAKAAQTPTDDRRERIEGGRDIGRHRRRTTFAHLLTAFSTPAIDIDYTALRRVI